jgi:ABC-type transport system involved in cytochrome c biogenesis permease component
VSFLPIVDRELRVAARKRHTFWLRVVSALVAVIIGVGYFIMSTIQTGGMQFGSAMFWTLTWFGLLAALGAGLFFTSDCLSEEKRQGTLGFLFLTDLRGYDVVLGKLLATS